MHEFNLYDLADMSDRQQELFDLMTQDHGLTLLQSEMHDIEHVVLRMSQWNPIETAPMDGTHIMLYRPHIQFVGYYAEDCDAWIINAPGLPEMTPRPPTRWQPLAEPPNP